MLNGNIPVKFGTSSCHLANQIKKAAYSADTHEINTELVLSKSKHFRTEAELKPAIFKAFKDFLKDINREFRMSLQHLF